MAGIKVAYYGIFSGTSGYATGARAYVHALHEAGIELSLVDLTFTEEVENDLVAGLLRRKMVPDFHLVHAYPPMAVDPLALYFPSSKVISVTVWETDVLPARWRETLGQVSDVWVPSEFNRVVFERELHRPVFRWPRPFDSRLNAAEADDSRLPTLGSGTYVFFSTFAWQDRKCPLGIVEAFLKAFRGSEDVALVLKTNGTRGVDVPARIADVRALTGSSARIEVMDETWTLAQMEALSRRGDCYVSLHRGEGWCNPLFDAACRGKAIVATGCSGPADFLDPDDHFLVRFTEVSVEQDGPFFDRRMRWAQPDIEQAAEFMRIAFENRESTNERAAAVGRRLRERHTLSSIGRLARERLSALM